MNLSSYILLNDSFVISLNVLFFRALPPSKKPPADSSDDDEYGNFEADSKPQRRSQSQGRGKRGRK